MIAWPSIVVTDMSRSETRVNTNLNDIRTTQTTVKHIPFPTKDLQVGAAVRNLRSAKYPWILREYPGNGKCWRVSARTDVILTLCGFPS